MLIRKRMMLIRKQRFGKQRFDMARQTSLKGKLLKLRRRYKKVSKERFFYNNFSELKAEYSSISCWFLIHDDRIGYSIMNMSFRVSRESPLPVGIWAQRFTTNVMGWDSLFFIFTQKVLPAINNRGGNQWKFKSLIGWTGQREFSKTDNSDSPSPSKTVKKRSHGKRGQRRSR